MEVIGPLNMTVVTRAASIAEDARALRIADAQDYAVVAGFLQGVKALRAEIAATFDEHIKRAYDAHRALCDEKRRAEAEAVTAERIAKDLLVAWDTEQERERLAEQRRLAALVAEDVIDRAVEAEAAGDVDTAAAILDTVPVAAVTKATPKVAGVRFTERWSARVDDLGKLVAHIAANPSLLPLIQPNMTALNQQARSLKSRLALPGVSAVRTKDVAAGSGR